MLDPKFVTARDNFDLQLCKVLLSRSNELSNVVLEIGDLGGDLVDVKNRLNFCKFVGIRKLLLKGNITDCVRTLLRENKDLQIEVSFEIVFCKNLETSWDEWHTLHKSTDFSSNVNVALNLSGLNSSLLKNSRDVLDEWITEKIGVLIMDENSLELVKNNCILGGFIKRLLLKSSPHLVLHRNRKKLSRKLNFEFNNNEGEKVDLIRILPQNPTLISEMNEIVKQIYLDANLLWNYEIEGKDAKSLSSPLKPVTDVLSSHTYTNFELDLFKYQKYGEAICRAILDITSQKRKLKEKLEINVAILGASRGALVDLVYRACKKVPDFECHITAVEINQFAMFALQQRNRSMWGKSIQTKCQDLRLYKPTHDHKPDLVLSEFLGSFACNELAPTVFSGINSIIKSTTKIIPKQYTNYIQPCYVPKFTACMNSARPEKYEQPYILNVAGVLELSKPLPLFTYQDPCDRETLKRMEKSLEFKIERSGEVTGIFGYFHSILYEENECCTDLCTLPLNHTPGLKSWAPMFFPIKDPIFVKKGDILKVNWRRNKDGIKVWYEWQTEHPPSEALSIWHNLGGVVFHLDLF